MGFNISGIVINKNYKNNLEDLKKDFGWNLKFVEEIDFEKASANWKEKGVCDIYFSEQASFIFVDMEMCIEAWCVADAKTLTFALSETSMAFKLRYSEGDKVLRSIMEVERNRRIDEGEKLHVEKEEDDTSEIIWNQIEQVLGKKFWDIDYEEKAYRYKFISDYEERSESGNKKTNKTQGNKKKPWWRFW